MARDTEDSSLDEGFIAGLATENVSREDLQRFLAEYPGKFDMEPSTDEDYSPQNSPHQDLTPKRKRRGEPKKETKKNKTDRQRSVPLNWYVENGAVVAAPRMSVDDDTKGYSYLLEKDWESSEFPYTVLEGKYKSDRRLYVFGKENETSSVIVMLRSAGGQKSLEVFSTATAAATAVIEETQATAIKKNSARLSGYDYLKVITWFMSWMTQPEKQKSLRSVRADITGRVEKDLPRTRNSDDLYRDTQVSRNLPGATELPASETTPKQEDTQQYSAYLRVPGTLLTVHSTSPLQGITGLSNGLDTLQIGQGHLVVAPQNWGDDFTMTQDEIAIQQSLLETPEHITNDPDFSQIFAEFAVQNQDWPTVNYDFCQMQSFQVA